MSQRMHVVTVQFASGANLAQIQSAYDDGFIMPDGSWRRISEDPPVVEIAAVLDDLPFEIELSNLKAGLNEFVDAPFEVLNVGEEEDHRDLDPCFAYLNQQAR